MHTVQFNLKQLNASYESPNGQPGQPGRSVDFDAGRGGVMGRVESGFPDLLGAALFGVAWPGTWHGDPCSVQVLFDVNGVEPRPIRCGLSRQLRIDGPAPGVLERFDVPRGLEHPGEGVEELTGLSAEAFLRQVLLEQRAFADFLRAAPGERGALLDALTGPALQCELSLLAWHRCLSKRGTARPGREDMSGVRDELARTLDELGAMEALLTKRAAEVRNQDAVRRAAEEIRELDRRRGDWERNRALFLPLQERLERGRRALELGDEYAALRDLRQEQEQGRLALMNLRENLASVRAEFQNAEEGFSVKEAEFRDKLIAQKRLLEVVQTVTELDRLLQNRQIAVAEVQEGLETADSEFRRCSASLEKEQSSVEKLGLSLREARKYLQTHASDEKLVVGILGIQKCFSLYIEAQEKRAAVKEAYARAIQKKQQSQIALGDRQTMFSDVSHKFNVVEKNYERAQSFYESSLKGKSIPEWREICAGSLQRLEDLDRLASRFREEEELHGKLKGVQDRRLRIRQETRELNIRDVEQAGKIEELQGEIGKLERRVSLLQKMEDLDVMRELLQDAAPCPLCGAITHPYTSGAAVPDPEEAHRQLHEAMAAMEELKDELSARQDRTGLLSGEMSSLDRGEEDLRRDLASLGDAITEGVTALGLNFGVGIPPLEELDRVRQKVRDQLQRARSVLDAAEAAEHDRDEAADELARIRESREELTRYHQEALFQLQNDRAEEARLEGESRSQEETFNSLRRELITQLSPYGYKSVPDTNPQTVMEALEKRVADWQGWAHKNDEIEHDLAVAQSAMTAAGKEKESFKLQKEELGRRLKSLEAERDSIRQQRIILFAEKDPEAECERMERDVQDLREQVEARRLLKNESTARMQELMVSVHEMETAMATQRDQLQRSRIAFGKRILAAGFKSEDDYVSACLTDAERRDLQERFKALTQMDLEITAGRENARALQMELQARQGEFRVSIGDRAEFLRRLLDLNDKAAGLCLSLAGDAEAERLYREFGEGISLRLCDLELGNGDEETRRRVRDLIFGAILDHANRRLSAGGSSMRLSAGSGPLELEGASDTSRSALALAWGLSDLFAVGTAADLRLLDAELDSAGPEGLQRLEEQVRAMRRPEEAVLLCAGKGV